MSEMTATMAYLAENGCDLLVKCSGPYDKLGPHPVFQLEPKEYLRRFGPSARMCDLEAKYSCDKCGKPISTEVVQQFSRDKDGKWVEGRDGGGPRAKS